MKEGLNVFNIPCTYMHTCVCLCVGACAHLCLRAWGSEGIAWVQPIFYLTQRLSSAWSSLHWTDALANKPPRIPWLHLPSPKAHFLKSSLSFSSVLARQKLWSLGRNWQWRHSLMGILSHWSFIDHSALPLETFSRSYLLLMSQVMYDFSLCSIVPLQNFQ